jgi:hypothetical protein
MKNKTNDKTNKANHPAAFKIYNNFASSLSQTVLAAAAKRTVAAFLFIVMRPVGTIMSYCPLHLVYRCQQFGAQIFIEIDSMLFCIGIDNNPKGH